MTRERVGRAGLLAIAGALLFAGGSLAQEKLKPVNWLTPGTGLAGGGTGPTVTVGIAPGGVGLTQISTAAKDALKGATGPVGPAGPTGPQGPKGDTGPAGTAPASTVYHAELAASVFPVGQQPTALPGMAVTFTLTRTQTVRAYTTAYEQDGFAYIELNLNGKAIASAFASNGTQPALARLLSLPPGQYTLHVSAHGWYDPTICGVGRAPGATGPLSYLDVEVQ